MPDAATPVPRLDLLARKIMICSVAYILNVNEQHFLFGIVSISYRNQISKVRTLFVFVGSATDICMMTAWCTGS